MASTFPPDGSIYDASYSEAFDSDKLDLVQQAFDAAWLELSAAGFTADEATDGDLRSLLGEKIMALAAAGEFDSNQLVSRALKSFRAF
ncbi:hypothetical protein A7A08_01181 [Methyloligella halotolerans]|uniref:Uncharacterized protein n=2 Tax=Methyloligella halotolerans TaxID=1177755 RepID=A0A1E2S0M1_9HYPH|nr:hypothetical protein A7A08_01181 [Methyloligella halotolerans]